MSKLHYLRTPPAQLLAQIFADQERRHAWLIEASAKVRRWRADDERKGHPWGGMLSTDQENEEPQA